MNLARYRFSTLLHYTLKIHYNNLLIRCTYNGGPITELLNNTVSADTWYLAKCCVLHDNNSILGCINQPVCWVIINLAAQTGHVDTDHTAQLG